MQGLLPPSRNWLLISLEIAKLAQAREFISSGPENLLFESVASYGVILMVHGIKLPCTIAVHSPIFEIGMVRS